MARNKIPINCLSEKKNLIRGSEKRTTSEISTGRRQEQREKDVLEATSPGRTDT